MAGSTAFRDQADAPFALLRDDEDGDGSTWRRVALPKARRRQDRIEGFGTRVREARNFDACPHRRRLKPLAVSDGAIRNPASAEVVDRPTVRYTGEFDTFDGNELAALTRHATDEQDARLYLTAAMTGRGKENRWGCGGDIDFAGQRV